MRNVRSAKAITRYQNIPSRYQIRATGPHEMMQQVPSFDTVRTALAAVAVSIQGTHIVYHRGASSY